MRYLPNTYHEFNDVTYTQQKQASKHIALKDVQTKNCEMIREEVRMSNSMKLGKCL